MICTVFSQAHFIGQNAAEMAALQGFEPPKAHLLIGAEHRLQMGRNLLIALCHRLEVPDHGPKFPGPGSPEPLVLPPSRLSQIQPPVGWHGHMALSQLPGGQEGHMGHLRQGGSHRANRPASGIDRLSAGDIAASAADCGTGLPAPPAGTPRCPGPGSGGRQKRKCPL